MSEQDPKEMPARLAEMKKHIEELNRTIERLRHQLEQQKATSDGEDHAKKR